MAANKYYGVRKGKITGVLKNWDECKESVTGYPGAEYKGFKTREEAEAYLGLSGMQEDMSMSAPNTLVAYVDGSFSEELGKYSFGCVFLVPNGKIYTTFGNGDNPQSLQHRNVTGEMLGAMYAVKTAMKNGYDAIDIYYDYEGIEKWVTGVWKSKTEYTSKYAASMKEWGKNIRIRFIKVPAHSNVTYNELADVTAKQGLIDGMGIPKICLLEEMTEWNKCD